MKRLAKRQLWLDTETELLYSHSKRQRIISGAVEGWKHNSESEAPSYMDNQMNQILVLEPCSVLLTPTDIRGLTVFPLYTSLPVLQLLPGCRIDKIEIIVQNIETWKSTRKPWVTFTVNPFSNGSTLLKGKKSIHFHPKDNSSQMVKCWQWKLHLQLT